MRSRGAPVQIAPQPGLSPQQRAEAERVARRLADELRSLVELLPERDRGASAMARALSLDRVTCQRIVGATGKGESSLATLVQLPGIQGLQQFLAAMGRRKHSRAQAEQMAAAGAAVAQFQAFLDHVGGSQRQLKLRLETAVPGSLESGSGDAAAREALFQAAAAVTGRWSETISNTWIIRPVPGNPRLTEDVRVRAMVGHVARQDAVPLEINQAAPLRPPGASGPAFEGIHDGPTGDAPNTLLPAFCSVPLPRVTSRSVGNRVLQVIDIADESGPADIVLAARTAQPDRHPATLRPAMGEVWLLVTFPARRMIFDVFLHREIARRCIPSLEVHLWGPDVSRPGSSRWSTRFPGGPRLELMGAGLGGASTPSYPRQAELIGHVLSELDWSPDDFVGYRCEVQYPIWRAGYCMAFDFAGSEMPEEA